MELSSCLYAHARPVPVRPRRLVGVLLGLLLFLPALATADEPRGASAEDEAAGYEQAFTHVLQTRKRQLVTSYYLYRGPVPSDLEMARAIGAIDRLILQDYSLEDIWSTIFHILISEPQLAMKAFEDVIPPNIRRAAVWREASTPVKVVIEELYPEYSFVYTRALQRKRILTWGGAGLLVPTYAISVAFGTSATGNIYNKARANDVDFSPGNAFLPLIPIVGPIVTQVVLDSKSRELSTPSFDAGSHLIGAVWATLLQSLGATAVLIGLSQRLPAPFEPATTSTGPSLRPKPRVAVRVGPGGAGLTVSF